MQRLARNLGMWLDFCNEIVETEEIEGRRHQYMAMQLESNGVSHSMYS